MHNQGRRTGRAACAIVSWLAVAPPALAQTAEPPPGPPERRWRWEVGATGENVFEHTRASLRDPHFGMRLYRDDPVPGTLHEVADPLSPDADARAAAPNGQHVFWDASFGERAPLFSFYKVDPRRARWVPGVQVNLEAAAFLLLDFDSQSTGVIDTDFHLGGSIDVRPPLGDFDLLSLSAGYYHESTHLGDEYVLSAATIQAGAVPSANPALPYRANPSVDAATATLSVDLPVTDRLAGRLYGGATKYVSTELPNGDLPSDWRAGAELRWTMSAEYADVVGERYARSGSAGARALGNVMQRSTGAPECRTVAAPERMRRGPFGVELGYEYLATRRYEHVGAERTATFVSASGWFVVQHAMLMGLYNLDTRRSSSNAVGLSIDWIRGRSPFGQLVEYTRVDAFAAGFQYYW